MRYGSTNSEYNGIITSLILDSILLLMQPEFPLMFLAAILNIHPACRVAIFFNFMKFMQGVTFIHIKIILLFLNHLCCLVNSSWIPGSVIQDIYITLPFPLQFPHNI